MPNVHWKVQDNLFTSKSGRSENDVVTCFAGEQDGKLIFYVNANCLFFRRASHNLLDEFFVFKVSVQVFYCVCPFKDILYFFIC